MSSFHLTRAVVFAACSLLLGGCHDASEPLAVVLGEQSRAVLAAEAGLPSLPRLAEEAGAEARLAGALEGWSRSWEVPVEDGRDLRAAAYHDAAGSLALALADSVVAESVDAVGETLLQARGLDPEVLTEEISGNLSRAEAQHARATAALAQGREGEALEAALVASDLIREVGPESLGRLLIARAEERLRALEAQEPQPVSENVDLDRARRLIRGARLALAQEDFVRVVQRAFYACQLLGVEGG